jgi:hypothetical protein
MAVVVRALIPAGFMPAADFTYQICPDGFPAQLLHSEHAVHHAHHADGSPQGDVQHSGRGSHEHAARGEHCVFAAAAVGGLAPQTILLLTTDETAAAPHVYFAPAPPALAHYRAHQPRGPPTLS